MILCLACTTIVVTPGNQTMENPPEMEVYSLKQIYIYIYKHLKGDYPAKHV